ncbi:hypothetical protein [Actinoplanes sp. RD1]|uniref:hypothetical protein n=1 Tax=Actinoplanes sp. RD1 TaxID=3064538 RepID=UPI00274049BF|nr:hypothetical protein [Actinoplanes sp. RD1]
MSSERHLMMCVDSGDAESLFECTVDECGRRLVLDHVGTRIVVIDPGSSSALHHGSTGLVDLSATTL